MELPNLSFFHTLRVRYSEIDAQGIVFNAHYLTYFDTTLNELFREVGLVPGMPDPWGLYDGHDFHLVKSLVEYKMPVYFDDLIDVYAGLRKMGRSSLAFELYLCHHKSKDVRSYGEIVWVYANRDSQKSVAIPEAIRELLGPYLI